MDFDAHAHLPKNGIECVPEHWRGIVCATCETEFEVLAQLAALRSGVLPAFGIHPWFVAERSEKWFENLRRVLEKVPRAQIGEIGLDQARSKSAPLDEQIAVFVPQLRLAAERSLPATIHCVRAWQALFAVLSAEKTLPRMHFHAFSGSAEIAERLIKTADVTFSISAKQRLRGGKKLEAFLASVPPARLLEESDSDFSDC